MPVDCPAGWTGQPMPALLPNSTTLRANAEYVRVTYEWELADNAPALRCACGQTSVFSFGFGTTSEGVVTLTPAGVGGAVSAGETEYSELSVTVGPDDFEYLGYKMFLKETTEIGTVTTSGGFASGGLWSRLRFAWNFLWGGLDALLPSISYNAPHTIRSRHTQAAWKICKRPCS